MPVLTDGLKKLVEATETRVVRCIEGVTKVDDTRNEAIRQRVCIRGTPALRMWR